MRIAGQWVGLGLGDASEEVRSIKAFLRRKFSYAGSLGDHSLYDGQMVAVVTEMQRRYAAAGKIGEHVPGIINVETKYAMGYLARPAAPKPVVFTVEGHMSSMWLGPCAETARWLESNGLCKWQPVGYHNTALPFDNASGIRELRRLLADRTLLPPGTPWGMAIFSQGAIVGSEVFLRHIRPPSGDLHWRLADWRATLAFGSPYREQDVVAPWVQDPPRRGTGGISNVRMTNTPVDRWAEVARRGDLYTENEAGDSGEMKTAIYMAVQNQWSGHPDSLLNQMLELAERPLPEMIAMIKAIASGAMFLGDMRPHGGYDLGPCIDFMRVRLEGE